jgi:hypothetical protein
MSVRGALLAALLAGLVAAGSARPAAAAVTVTVDRASIAAELGARFSFRSTIANHGAMPARGLIAHLNVLSLRDGVYVDPEDWASDRTRYLGPIAPGGSRTLTWRLQAVTAGRLGVYVAVLDGRATAPKTGPAIPVEIAERRTLNAGGIVPVALGVPALLGLLALALGARRSDRR